MAEDKVEEAPIVRQFSHASGSISAMSDTELISANVPPAGMIDPGKFAEMRAKGIVPQGTTQYILSSGDKVYHKKQQIEATFIQDDKKPGMAVVRTGGKNYRVKKEHLVKL
jgi:hypothetical protein